MLLGTARYQYQYATLKSVVQQWLKDGTLSSTFTVTGHSLGGFLASAIAVDFAGQVSHTYLYNTPGLGGVVGSPLIALWNALNPDQAITIPDSLPITNIIADAGISPISDLGTPVSPRIPIYIENQVLSGVSDPPLAMNHSQRVLTDALAIYDLFSRVDPSVSMETVTSIIKAASNQTANTLESALSVLGAIYGKSYPAAETDRDAFYTNLYDLQGVIGSNQGTVVSLTGQSREQIAGLAKTDIAYRYALEWLAPFVVTGNDGLYTNQNFDGHLNADQFTDLYLKDRAAMLTWKMKFDSGAKDYNDLLPGDKSYDDDWDTWSIADDWKFTDVLRNITLTIDGTGEDVHHIVFGSRGADTISGDSKSDHLYGMDGSDTISGGDGDDYLEGGRGDDVLRGGAGYDTYVWRSGDGNDQIIDGREADGKAHGIIKIDNGLGQNVVVGGAYMQQGTSEVWKKTLPDGSGELTITYAGEWTLALADGSALTLGNFQDGDFGISLVDGTAALPDPEITGITISGDLAAKWFVGYTSDNVPYHYHKWDEFGNIITEGEEPGREDSLYDSAGNDHLLGYDGIDYLNAFRGGADILDGGSGDDWLEGGDGNDLLLGGAGSDAMFGGAGSDRLYADQKLEMSEVYLAGETGDGTGARGDLLSGKEDDDQLYAGADNDVLAGGAGADVIYGGAGDDTIEGDANLQWYYAEPWSVTRTVTEQDGVTLYHREYAGVAWEGIAEEQGDDTIYAGAGTDWVFAQGGNDFVDAGIGDDVVLGEGGDDIILGQAGNDILNGDSIFTLVEDHGDDYLDGGDGNDKMWGHGGTDILFGGAGDDELSGDSSVTPVEIQGDDYLDGGDGNDRMWGYGGADILIGGAGDDRVYGDSSGIPFVAHGDDYLDGGDGNDILVGSGGADTLLGGRDDDELYGDSSDTPAEAHGNDYLDGGEGNDILVGSGGADILLGGAGADQLHGDSSDTPLVVQGDDYLDGGEGNDYLGGYDGDDTLLGGAGDDTLYGQEGNDYLDGGAGVDYLDGGSGDDTYIFATGDSPMVVSDWFMTVEWIDDRQGLNALVLPSGYPLQLYYDDYGLTLQYGLGDYLYLIDGIMQASHYNVDTGAGAVSLRSLIAQQIDVPLFLEGSAADDVLQGGRGDDVLLGNDGDDLLDGAGGGDLFYGGAGNDTLWGGDGIDNLFGEAGNDTLLGGAGNDTYNFSADGGSDIIIDTSGDDQLVFGAGILASGVAASRTGSQVTLTVSATDSITFDETAPGHYAVETMLFEDGTVWQAVDIQQRLNAVPTGSVTVSGVATQGQTLTVTSNLADADGLGAIGYQWQSSTDGTIWNDIGGATADSFTLGEVQVGEQLRAVAGYTDGYGTVESLASTATAAIANVNDVPTGSVTISGAAAQDQTLTATNDLSDVDGLGAIGYQWQSSPDGTIWSDIGGATANSFALGEAQVGAQVRAMAGYTDGHDTVESVASTATTIIVNVNDAPTVAAQISTQLATEDAAFSFTIPVETFTDGDAGDSLTYTASLSDASALPYWLNFDAATRTFSGTPGSTSAGLWDVRVTATDNAGAGVSDDFVLDVANHLVGTATKDRLRGTTLRDVIEGLGGDDTLKGGAGNEILYGGIGNDTLFGDSGNDTYMFNLGDGSDIINNYDTTGFDTVSFGDSIGQNSVALFRNGNNLEIGYSDADTVSISKYFFNDKYLVDEVNLTDGSCLTAADINQIIQDMAAYAVNEGIALTSVNDVRNNEQVMSIVAGSWHA